MSAIREVFELEDKFTGTFTQYIKLANDAAANTRAVREAATRAAAASRVQSAAMNAAASSAKAQTAAYRTSVEQARAQAAASKAAAEAVRLETAELKKLKAEQDLTAKSTNSLVSSIKNMVGAYVGMQTLTGFVNLSDTMTQNTARLNMMNDGLQTTAELNQMIYESAQRSRGAYQDTADMVAKLGTLAGNAFNSSQEVVDFTEQLNKQITLSGASAQTASGAMLQLTQAMASGVLRGEELNSIMEGLPTVAQTIADYMGVSTGQMKELASEGAVTADVVKNALLGATEEVNEKFAQMPMTWSQVWTSFKNTATMATQPVLNAINSMANNIDTAAQFVVDNSALVEAALAGVAAGALLAGGIMVASATQAAFAWAVANAPILAVVAGVALMIFMARQAGATWQEIGSVVGGTVMLMYAAVMNNLIVPGQRAFAAFANFVGNVFNDPVTAVKVLFYDMAMGILGHIRSVASGIESLVNSIPGVEVSLTGAIDSLYNTLSANRQAAIEAGSYTEYVKAWNYVDYSDALQFGHNAGENIGSMLDNFDFSSVISGLTGGLNAFDLSSYTNNVPSYSELGGIADDVSDIAGSASSIQKAVNMSEEDLKSLVDVAERRYVNNINLTSQAPVIQITGQNTGNTAADRKNLADTIRDILVEQVASGSTINTATVPF